MNKVKSVILGVKINGKLQKWKNVLFFFNPNKCGPYPVIYSHGVNIVVNQLKNQFKKCNTKIIPKLWCNSTQYIHI